MSFSDTRDDGGAARRFLRHVAKTAVALPVSSPDPTWNAYLRGELSPIDSFESDGRVYVVVAVRRKAAVILSERERQAALLAADGLANKLIAGELGVTAATVANHLARAAEKLGVDTRVALIRVMRRSAA